MRAIEVYYTEGYMWALKQIIGGKIEGPDLIWLNSQPEFLLAREAFVEEILRILQPRLKSWRKAKEQYEKCLDCKNSAFDREIKSPADLLCNQHRHIITD